MKEENGKILLQPSFTKQQQTKHIKKQQTQQQHDKTKHEQQDKDGHQQWPDYKNQPLFQDFKRTISQEDEEEEQHQHFFQHSIQS